MQVPGSCENNLVIEHVYKRFTKSASVICTLREIRLKGKYYRILAKQTRKRMVF